MSEKKTVDKEDFDLTLKYNIFDILYSINRGLSELEVKEWCVIGYELDSGANRRCFDYVLISYPISIYIQANKRMRLSELLLREYVGTTKREVVTKASENLQSRFNYLLEALNANN